MTKMLSIKTEPRLAEYSRAYRHIDVENDVTVDDLLTPGFWAHHAGAVQPKDLLDVLSEDMRLDVQLRVIEVGVGFVTMRLCATRHTPGKAKPAVAEVEETGEPLKEPKGYKVGFTPARKHYVQSTLTLPPQIVSDGHQSRREAIEAAIEHAEKVATKIAA